MNKQPNSEHCFICGVLNIAGVHVSFYDTVDAQGTPEVLARFHGKVEHQGYPGRMHGGVITGILDETIGRAINHSAGLGLPGVWGVTIELTVRFQKPVPLGVDLTARGRVTRDHNRLFLGSGEIYLPDGTAAAVASGRFMKLGLNEIADAQANDLGWRVYPDATGAAA